MPSLVDDPADLTPQQRLQEIAAILAAGYLRLKTCAGQGGSVAAGSQPRIHEKAFPVK